MNVSQIWEVAGPLIITAVTLLIVGLILLATLRKIQSVLLKKIVRVIAILTIAGPLLFLLYTIIRAIIFLYFYYY
jgi:hypothetical protein